MLACMKAKGKRLYDAGVMITKARIGMGRSQGITTRGSIALNDRELKTPFVALEFDFAWSLVCR
jgi:hypothetical protein